MQRLPLGDKESLRNSRNEKLYVTSTKMRETGPDCERIYSPS